MELAISLENKGAEGWPWEETELGKVRVELVNGRRSAAPARGAEEDNESVVIGAHSSPS